MVDGAEPSFSNPTAITNPLFPASSVTQVIQLGVDHGLPLRVEVTRMPETRTIEWDGQPIEMVVSQFIAYRDGRVLEVAYDYFAQADDGSVWYFGELVDNYADGSVANHSGAWLAGVEGPPGMIMPASPQEGDIFHPENIPGVVFEELIVLETGVTTDGPTGEVTGAIRVEEHLMEGTVEQKIFAPGYGEFQADASDELVTVALAVPTDARDAPEPPELAAIVDDARLMLEAAGQADWQTIADTIEAATQSWQQLRTDQTPRMLADEMTAALEAGRAGADAGDVASVRRAAIAIAFAGLDLQLQYADVANVDATRMEFWARRLMTDAEDRSAARGDVATLETIMARVGPYLAATDADAVDAGLSAAQASVESADVQAMRAAAEELTTLLNGIRPDQDE